MGSVQSYIECPVCKSEDCWTDFDYKFVVKLRKSTPNTFKKKTFIIEAIRYTGDNGAELNKWSDGKVVESPVLEPTNYNPTGAYVQIHPSIKGADAKMFMPTTAIVGDWICKGSEGNFYSCKNDVFEAQYEKIEEE